MLQTLRTKALVTAILLPPLVAEGSPLQAQTDPDAAPWFLPGALWSGAGDGGFTIEIVFNGDGSATIAYPSIGCSGTLTPQTVEQDRGRFLEVIAAPSSSCPDGGEVELSINADGGLDYLWSQGGYQYAGDLRVDPEAAPTAEPPAASSEMAAASPVGPPSEDVPSAPEDQQEAMSTSVDATSADTTAPAAPTQGEYYEAAPGAATSSDTGGTLQEVDATVLLYRIAPQIFADDVMLQAAETAIAADQYVFSGERDEPTLFSRQEIEDRVASFAAQELLPTFKERLSASLASVPLDLTIVEETRLFDLEYGDGVIRRPASYSGPLFSTAALRDDDKLRLQPLGAREVLYFPHDLSGRMPERELPQGVDQALQRLGPRTQVYLALDRQLMIEALEIDAATAEDVWKRPDCSIDEISYAQAGLTREEAAQAAVDCRALVNRYTEDLRAEFDIQVEGVVVQEGAIIIMARLLGARVASPYGDVLRTFGPDEFAPATDVWRASAVAEAEAEAEAQAQAAAEQAALEEQARAEQEARQQESEDFRGRVERADVAGITLGMHLSEAEAVARAAMDLGWIGTLAPSDPSVFGSPDPNAPYGEFRTFISVDGNQQIVLFQHPERSDQVLAVARTIYFPQPIDVNQLATSLEEKYGPALEGEELSTMIWTANLGEVDGWSLEHNSPEIVFRMGTCFAGLRSRYGAGELTMLEGDPLTDYGDLGRIKTLVPVIDVSAGSTEGPRNDRRYYDPTVWRACGPTVLAEISPSGNGTLVTYAIFDLASYAELYVPGAPADAEVSLVPDL